MKYLIIFIVLFSQTAFSQISKFNYDSLIRLERNKEDNGKMDTIQNSYKRFVCEVVIDDQKKTITIGSEYISQSGNKLTQYANYDFVKKEAVKGAFHYFAVDLAGKKYLEFFFSPEVASICENFDEFKGCKNVTVLSK